MAVDLGSAYAEIKLKTENFHKALKDADGSLNTFSKGMGTAVKYGAEAALAGFAALTAGTAWVIKEFSEAQGVAAQTSAAITSTGGVANVTAEHVNSMAGSLRDLSGVSDEAIGSGENLLLTFTNIRNTDVANTFDDATKASLNMSIALKEDMSSAAMRVGKALQDPIAGVTALRKVGVQLTDAQKDQIQAFMDVNDVAGAQGVILEELNKEFGTSAEMAGQTLAGQLGILKSKFGDLAEEAGGKAAPAISGMLGSLIDIVKEVDISPIINMFSLAGNILTDLQPLIQKVFGVFGDVLGDATPILEKIVERLVPLLVESLDRIMSSGILDNLMTLFDAVSGSFLTALENIVPSMITLVDVLLKIVTPIVQIADKSGILTALIELWMAKKVWDTMTNFAGGLGGVNKELGAVGGNAGKATTAMGSFGSTAMGVMGVAGAAAFTGQQIYELVGAISAYSKANDEARVAAGGMVDSFNSIYGALASNGTYEENAKATTAMSKAWQSMGINVAVYGGTAEDVQDVIRQSTDIFMKMNREAMASGASMTAMPENIVKAWNTGEPQFKQAAETSVESFTKAFIEKGGYAPDEAAKISKDMALAMASPDLGYKESAYKNFMEYLTEMVKDGKINADEAKILSQQMATALDQPDAYGTSGTSDGTSFQGSLAQYLLDNPGFIDITTPDGTTTGQDFRAAVLAAIGDDPITLNAVINTNSTWIKQFAEAFGINMDGFHLGGQVRHLGGEIVAHGGMYLGDEVMVRAKKGEYVINDQVVRSLGVGYFDALNAGKNPRGGGTFNFYGDFILPGVTDAESFFDEVAREAERRSVILG